jgi:hypothetical protein
MANTSSTTNPAGRSGGSVAGGGAGAGGGADGRGPVVGADVDVWRSVTESARLALSTLEPRELTSAQVNAVLSQVVVLERMAASARVLLSKRAAETEQWKREGFRSAAEWLAAQQGTSTGRAKADIETSERLDGLEDTKEAMRDGLLSPDQAAAVADAATVNPDAEADLIGLAEQESLRRLRDEAARRRAEREDGERRRERIHRRRRARAWTDGDGAWNFSATGPAEIGSGFVVEWERLTDERCRAARRSGEHGTREQHAFDALAEMATRSHRRRSDAGHEDGGDGSGTRRNATDGRAAAGSAATGGDTDARGDTQGAGRGAGGSSATRENLRHLGLIRVDLTALRKGGVGDGELCEIAGVGPISVSAARELLGDAILKLVITRGADVVSVTHLGRGPTVAQQIALLWANPVCCVQGCNRVRRLEWDHRLPWAEVRETVLANLDGPCEFHHARKTGDGWALVEGTGRRPMVAPSDPRHPRRAARERAPNAPPAA